MNAMSNPPRDKVSTIITTYYRNDFLDEAIESVRNQTYDNIELIVVDGSGESFAEPVIENHTDIIYIPQDTDNGPHAARAEGFEHSTGKYVQYLDDDDLYDEEKTEKQVKELKQNDAGVVYCGTQDPGQIKLPSSYPKEAPSLKGDILEESLDNAFLYPCAPSTMMIKRNVLNDLMPLTHINKLSGSDGHALIIELAMDTSFDYVDQPLTIRRHHDREITSDKKLAGESMISLMDQYESVYEKYPRIKQRYLSRAYGNLANWHLNENIFSPTASYYYLKKAKTSRKVNDFALFTSSIFGKPGVTAARWLYNRL